MIDLSLHNLQFPLFLLNQDTQTESANEFIYSGKLQLPAGTDVRVNDKVVDKNTGLAYTAEMPHNIRDHHIMVNIQRKGTVKGAL